MRIWSIHPKYLDTKGLLALWRETLLAKHVLEGKSKGYTRHPQLDRFKRTDNPVESINQYLAIIYQDADKRGYHFNKNIINWNFAKTKIAVTKGQVNFEKKHLLNKLKIRDIKKYITLSETENIDVHPLFEVIEGNIEPWEKI